VALATVVWQFY